jgi:hypothetical protein
MNEEISQIVSLRRILESSGQGSGLSRSIVEELRDKSPPEKDAARMVLLGNPVPTAMDPLLSAPSEEVSMLASLVAAAPRSSAPLVGRTGNQMALTLERWVKARQSRALEMKVMRFRSLVTSGVLGAVTAMVSSLGPLVGNLSLGGATGSGDLVYGAAAMTAISSGMLGVFMSGKGFYSNVVLSMAVFALVAAAASPLASVSPAGVLGVI